MLNINVSANNVLTFFIDIYREMTMTQLVNAATDWLNISGILEMLKQLRVELRAAREIQHTIDELEKLTDRELNDLGIGRGNIRSVAMECYYDNRKV
jgi:uncharacterized protein YjiS (DUF1127 family)